MRRKKVAVICGGRSNEHEISCISARGIISSIDRNLFDPILVGVTKGGHWVLLDETSPFVSGEDSLPAVPEDAPRLSTDINGFTKSGTGEPIHVDLAFSYIHGAYGEDGSIQGFFEMAGIPYIGSGVLASAVAMDKTFAKPIYASLGLKVAPGFTLVQRDWIKDQKREIGRIKELGLPVFIKPARSGSSRGTSKVTSETQIVIAVESALEHDPRVMVESAIVGREIECGILEIDGSPRASVVGEIKIHPSREFYDFQAKYLDNLTTFEVPASISEEIAAKVKDAALRAFIGLGCEGLARVDFFLTDTGEVIINELNTLPGFTEKSVFPMLWQASGISYTEVITHLCTSALQRSASVIR